MGRFTGKEAPAAVFGSAVLRSILFADIELAHASAQGAPIKTKDFSRTVFAAYFPLRLFQYLEDVLFLHRLQGSLTGSCIFDRLLQFIDQPQFRARRVDHRPFEDIFKLPNIARPVVIL